jgi:hypothetical protein
MASSVFTDLDALKVALGFLGGLARKVIQLKASLRSAFKSIHSPPTAAPCSERQLGEVEAGRAP